MFYWMNRQTGEIFTYPQALIEYSKMLTTLEEILGREEVSSYYYYHFDKFFECSDVEIAP